MTPYKFTDILEGHTAYIFRVEEKVRKHTACLLYTKDGSSTFLWNVCKLAPDYMAWRLFIVTAGRVSVLALSYYVFLPFIWNISNLNICIEFCYPERFLLVLSVSPVTYLHCTLKWTTVTSFPSLRILLSANSHPNDKDIYKLRLDCIVLG
jgi:hypothetical protein